MSTQTGSAYGIAVTVQGPFDQAVERTKQTLKAEGFGTLTEIDVRKTLQEKIGQTIEPYTILGVCNPHLASRSIQAEHEIGLLLPCNVLVHECGGQVRVSVQDPLLMVKIVGNEALQPIAEEARAGIGRALATLGASLP